MQVSQALSEALRSSFGIVKLVMAILVVVFLASGFFTVGPQERAIILRFGKPVGVGDGVLLGPGLHWSFPYPIDDVQKVSITGIQKVGSTVGWFATTPEMELAGAEPMAGLRARSGTGWLCGHCGRQYHSLASHTELPDQ